jgi:hypothetical protein
MQNVIIINCQEDVHLKANFLVKTNKGKNCTKCAQTKTTYFFIWPNSIFRFFLNHPAFAIIDLWYKWNWSPTKLFHATIIIDLHFTCIHSLFLLWSWTHITLPFIKTLDSWLFHITKIYTLVYIVKNSRNKIIIHFIIFWYDTKITQRYEHKIHYKGLCFFVLLKTWIKIITGSHVLLKKCIQNNN